MSVTAGVFDAVIPVRDRLRGKLGKTKVPRYRPGRIPEWADNVEEDSVGVWADDALVKIHEADTDMVMCHDSRLCRLKDCITDNREKVIAEHILFRNAEVVKEENLRETKLKPEEENEYALKAKRMRTREKLLFQMQQEDASLLVTEEDEDEVSEYEDDSGDNELGDSLMVRPEFVSKEERLTTGMQECLDAMKLSLTRTEEKRMAEMKAETRKMVVEEIKKDENIQRSLDFGGDIVDVDTDDEVNAADEYKAWVMREVPRIRRDRETGEVKNRGEEKILEGERNNPRPASAPKRKWRLMQVYYHKGAFFQDADDHTGTVGAANIYRSDFFAPTGEDKMDKTILPKIMQVKRFGRSGRTKWTHLVNEDTTDWNSPWTYNDSLTAKYINKMAGMKAISKRRKNLDGHSRTGNPVKKLVSV